MLPLARKTSRHALKAGTSQKDLMKYEFCVHRFVAEMQIYSLTMILKVLLILVTCHRGGIAESCAVSGRRSRDARSRAACNEPGSMHLEEVQDHSELQESMFPPSMVGA